MSSALLPASWIIVSVFSFSCCAYSRSSIPLVLMKMFRLAANIAPLQMAAPHPASLTASAEPLAANISQAADEKPAVNEKPYDEMLGYLREMEEAYDTQIIVMFHPFETINADGTISFSQADHAKVFSQYAEKYDIGFVDMTNGFETMYDEEHHVPHGFATGETGVGHLNRYGHAAISESLYQYIRSMEVE